jgi:hypothetical protein
MAIGYVTSLRTTRITAVNTAIGASGKLRIYSGVKPAVGGAETTILATLPLSATAGTVSNGVLTFNAITNDSSADATGTPTWARLMTSADVAVADMTAGVGSGDINFDASIVVGGVVSVTSLVITDGSS